jgi:hypothetical protein
LTYKIPVRPIGGQFQLRAAATAVDSHIETVRRPGDSVVKVISEASDGKLVHAVSDGRQFAMLATDLPERGQVAHCGG